jgi:hypothetical protein
MKIILQAFQGKLQSEPMDWPESIPLDVRLRMDIENTPYDPHDPNGTPVTHLCRFVDAGIFVHIAQGGSERFAQVYRLVAIERPPAPITLPADLVAAMQDFREFLASYYSDPRGAAFTAAMEKYFPREDRIDTSDGGPLAKTSEPPLGAGISGS